MMTRSRATWSAAVLPFILLCLAQPASAQDERKWGAFLDLEGKVGTKRKLGEADLFVPLLQDERTLLFGDARFKIDDQNSWEGNLGLGARRMLESGWNIGGYGYFDRRRSPNANFFDQLTFGAELLGTNFDLRANSYWPVGSAVQPVGPTGAPTSGATTATVSGTSIVVTTAGAAAQTVEYALRGFDAEVGVRIPIVPASSSYSLRAFAGGFRFDEAGGAVPVVAGPRLRLEFTDHAVEGLWNGTRFTVGAEWQTDEVRGSQFFAGLRLRVPLQGESRRASFTPQERRMTDPVVRDVDIVTGLRTVATAQPSLVEIATQTQGGQTITVVNSGSTTGANLPTAVTNAGANGTVVLVGTFNTGASQVTLQSGQTVMGSGTLGVRTASGRTATANLPGSTISATNANAVIMANNSTLTGMTVTQTNNGSATAVLAGSVSDVTITNNTLTGQSTAGGLSALTLFTLTGTSTISGNSITAIGTGGPVSTALTIGNSATGNFTVSGNTLSVTGSVANRHTTIGNATVLTGSTGNVISAGACLNNGGVIGSISYTNGTTCP